MTGLTLREVGKHSTQHSGTGPSDYAPEARRGRWRLSIPFWRPPRTRSSSSRGFAWSTRQNASSVARPTEGSKCCELWLGVMSADEISKHEVCPG